MTCKIMPALAVAATVMGFLAPQVAGAAVIIKDVTTSVDIPGIAQFGTDGADMTGMSVTVNFAGGGSETVAWQATGADSGAALGSGWSIRESGSTFADFAWNVDFGALNVASLVMDGAPGLTLFDTTIPAPGTPDSELGKDFLTNLADDVLITATYSNIITVGGNLPVGDLFQLLTVDFSLVNNASGATGTFAFSQDTDNDIRRVQVPEPSILTIFGIGLTGLGFAARRRRAA